MVSSYRILIRAAQRFNHGVQHSGYEKPFRKKTRTRRDVSPTKSGLSANEEPKTVTKKEQKTNNKTNEDNRGQLD